MGYTHYFEDTSNIDPKTNALLNEILEYIYTDETKTVSLSDVFAKNDDELEDGFFHETSRDKNADWKRIFILPSYDGDWWSFTKTARKKYDIAILLSAIYEWIAIRNDFKWVSSDWNIDHVKNGFIRFLDTKDISELQVELDKYIDEELGYWEDKYETTVNFDKIYEIIEKYSKLATNFDISKFENYESDEQKEMDKENELNEIARLIKEWYTSSVNPSFELTYELFERVWINELDECSLEHISTLVQNWYTSWELNVLVGDSDETVLGWWEIEIN